MSEWPVVAEGLGATWFYHLRGAEDTDALCGAGTFATNLPLCLWGHVGHLGERYCRKCEGAAKSAGVTFPIREVSEGGPKA